MYYLNLNFFSVSVLLIFLINIQNKSVNAKIGDLDNYTSEELQKLSLLHARIKNIIPQPYMQENKYLIRFLRAKYLNVDSAEILLRENFKWRKEKKIDEIARKDFTKWRMRGPTYLFNDTNGRPAFVIPLVDFDLRKLLLSGLRQEYLEYTAYLAERQISLLHKISKELNKEIITVYQITNAAGFSTRKHACLACLSIISESIAVGEKYYPNLSHEIIYVNLPRAVVNLFDVIKPLLSQHTISVIRSFGFNKEEFSKYFLKFFAIDQLPVEFGGTSDLRKLTPI